MYIPYSLLLHFSAAHWPLSNSSYYVLGESTALQTVPCTCRHIVVVVVFVNLFRRIFLFHFSQQPFQCSFILVVSFAFVYFGAVCSCTHYIGTLSSK
jgi:hypothetical protein